MLTTRNFRDIYTIQGNDRGEIFSIRWNKPEPFVPLENTYTARERIAADGEVVEPLNSDDVGAFADAVEAGDFESIAICFLFPSRTRSTSWRRRRSCAGGCRTSTSPFRIAFRLNGANSNELRRRSWTATWRRSSAVICNGWPPASRDRLPEGRALHVMESNGGVMSTTAASTSPLQTLLSGPVGGAIGGRALAASTGRKNLICIDMGGTSFRRQPDH